MCPVEFADELKAMKVLLIDDEQHIRLSMRYFFKQKTSSFTALENAEEALERLDSEPYDIVICDYGLPGMSGLTFFEILGRTSPDTIRILITANANREIEAEAIRVGVHDFIRKPFDGKTIENSLSMQIQKRREKSREVFVVGKGKKEWG